MKGIPYPLAAFENKRSFLGIDNVCFVVKQLLSKNDVTSGIYNISDGIIAKTSNTKPSMWKVNPLVIRMIARAGDLLSLRLNSHSLEKLTESYVVSNRKLIGALGRELPLRSKEGIARTVLSLMNNKS